MTHHVRFAPIVGTVLLAACGREPAVDPQLKADLDAASAGAIELAPAATGTRVVSGIEQVQRTHGDSTAARPRATVASPAQKTQEASAASKEPAATVPTSRPAVQPPPPGGYKSVDEVIRKAPFPIKPVEKKP